MADIPDKKNLKNKKNNFKKFNQLNFQDKKNSKKTIKTFRPPTNEGGTEFLDKKIIEKYSRGEKVKIRSLRGGLKREKIKNKEEKFAEAEIFSARAEVLLTENPGALEAKEGTYTSHITQRQIRESVDITSARKGFELSLTEYGPYRFRYSQNGRNLVLCGRKGHIASFDWVTKKLYTELNVMESVYDICYLHNEGMMAAAQKDWTYIYDNLGNEIHCLKHMYRALNLEFLHYFFLLCSSSETGFLSWLDISLGKEVYQTKTYRGKLNVMCQNPWNGILCCGHTNGTISMWTPNTHKPVLSMLCHPQAVRALSIDPSGKYIATGSVDRTLRIWDARNLGDPISSYRLPGGIDKLSFSQTNFLGVSSKKVVEVYRNVGLQEKCNLYMRHYSNNAVTGLRFCPYEDILGCSLYDGFESLIIPGSGEPNFDALEANPYISGSGRKETEVKALLEKVPSDLITLDPLSIAQIDVPTLEEKLEAKKKLLYVKVPKIDVQPRYRMKGKSGSARKFKRKSVMKEQEKREYLKFIKTKRQALIKSTREKELAEQEKHNILDRFKPKKKNVVG